MTPPPLHGRVAIVTGGGKGLGRAFALHLAQLGAAVVVNNRNRGAPQRGPAAEVAEEIMAAGGQAVPDDGDVGDPATAERLVATALDRWGRLDVCVTSAAVSGAQVFHRTTVENLTEVLRTNVVGTALVAAAALRVMRENGFGRIVMVSSTAGLHGEPTTSAYAASKGAVIALGRTVAAEGARRGVLTNVLLPYATTQMTAAGMDSRYVEAMRPELVAPVVGALADPAGTLNGEVLVAGGGALRVTESVEAGTVQLPGRPGNGLTGAELSALVLASRRSERRAYRQAQHAFRAFAAETKDGRTGSGADDG